MVLFFGRFLDFFDFTDVTDRNTIMSEEQTDGDKGRGERLWPKIGRGTWSRKFTTSWVGSN